MFLQYLEEPGPAELAALLHDAGESTGAAAPLAWLRMEFAGDLAALTLTTWPGGEEREIARAGYHGRPVHGAWGEAAVPA
jgi:hypothetical protein